MDEIACFVPFSHAIVFSPRLVELSCGVRSGLGVRGLLIFLSAGVLLYRSAAA